MDSVIFCPDCASTNVVLFPKGGKGAYRCLDCGRVMYNPIISKVVKPTVETE